MGKRLQNIVKYSLDNNYLHIDSKFIGDLSNINDKFNTCSAISISVFVLNLVILFLGKSFAFSNLLLAASKPTKTLVAFLANIFTALPGYALLSCIIHGILYLCAAKSTGPQIYPPVPITISGLNSFKIFFESPKDFTKIKAFCR